MKDHIGRNRPKLKPRTEGFLFRSRFGDEKTTGVSLKDTKEFDKLRKHYEEKYCK